MVLGDDDLLVPNAIKEVSSLIKDNQDCDFFGLILII